MVLTLEVAHWTRTLGAEVIFAAIDATAIAALPAVRYVRRSGLAAGGTEIRAGVKRSADTSSPQDQ